MLLSSASGTSLPSPTSRLQRPCSGAQSLSHRLPMGGQVPAGVALGLAADAAPQLALGAQPSKSICPPPATRRHPPTPLLSSTALIYWGLVP